MDVKRSHAPRAQIRVLGSRIADLDLDEDRAIRRRDWSAATNVSLTRALLRETRQRISVPERR